MVFCLMAGGIYLVNDLVDLEADRRHPYKKNRPLASGLISAGTAKWFAMTLLFISAVWAGFLGIGFFLAIMVYLVVQFAYNFKLKDFVILDVFCVSAGFFLRVVAGGAAVNVPISNWLVICTISIAMFLTLGKRRSELVLLGKEEARLHRKVFVYYTPRLLNQMISIVTAVTLLCYMLYCISPETIGKFQTDHLIYTFPFVLYGIFRYLYLMYEKLLGDSPGRVLMLDRPLLLSVLLWGICCVLIIYGVI